MDKALLHDVIEGQKRNPFSNKHGLQHLFPDWWITKMEELGEKYRPVRWLPLDIPKIELDDIEEFKDLWEKESIDILRVRPDAAEPWSKETHPYKKSSSWHVPSFRGLHLFENGYLAPISHESFSGKLYTGDNRQLKRILEQVFDYFPIYNFLSVFIWQSTREIKPHRDRSFFWKCPTDFRVMLHDENTEPTLYVADMDERDIHYIDCPEDTNSFCWSNGTQVHGSDYYGQKKWLLVINGIQSVSKCDELFSRSIRKYKDQLNYDLNINL